MPDPLLICQICGRRQSTRRRKMLKYQVLGAAGEPVLEVPGPARDLLRRSPPVRTGGCGGTLSRIGSRIFPY